MAEFMSKRNITPVSGMPAQTSVKLKKLLSHCPGQIDLPSGQITFHSDLPDGQRIMQVINRLHVHH